MRVCPQRSPHRDGWDEGQAKCCGGIEHHHLKATRDAEYVSQHPNKVGRGVHKLREVSEQRYSCKPRPHGLDLFEKLPDAKAFVLDASGSMWARRHFFAFQCARSMVLVVAGHDVEDDVEAVVSASSPYISWGKQKSA